MNGLPCTSARPRRCKEQDADEKPLTGRRALVTGASGGIGGAIARSLVRAGAEVVMSYSGHRDDAEAVGRSIRELEGAHLWSGPT